MATEATRAASGRAPSVAPAAVALTLLGGLCGLAWAAGLRGFMAQIAHDGSTVTWAGTFAWVLLPGVAVGLLLGWAEYVRRTGGRRGWRWLALSPLLFGAVLLSNPSDLLGIFEDGLGGGAVGVAILGMAGAYAISGRGARWTRVVCGTLAAATIPVWAFTVETFAGQDLALTTPRGLWVALYYYSFMALLMLASAIPHRAVTHQ